MLANGARPPRLSASAVSWAFVESGRTSYAVLISVYVFVPYLAAVLVGDPVKGQSLVAQLGQWAGLAAAAVAPLLGSTIDHLGRRKPLLIGLTLLSVPLCAALWFATPGELSVISVAVILAVTNVIFTLCEVSQNSLLVHATRRDEQAGASGLAHAFGNGVSVLVMIFVLWVFILPATMHAAWLPKTPWLSLSAARHEPERSSGPLCAILMIFSVVPMIFFTRDAPRASIPLSRAVRQGVADLRGLWGLMREAPAARVFLLSRMVFADAQGGIVMFTGVFAAGVLGWGPTELLVEGLVSSIFATLGGLFAGWLDNRIGAKRSLFLTLTGCLICALGEIGVSKSHIFWWAADPAISGRPWALPLFNTWPDFWFIGCDFGMSVFVVASFASSRTLMAQLAPPGRSAAFFGLFALSGRATAWACPWLVGLATAAFASQQLGYLPIAGMTVVGLAILAFVKAPPMLSEAPTLDALIQSPPRAVIPEP